uniref:F-box domain-containing protein n=1 Tax=Bionectria ochroleuca TaxID=29856 RepID=A0A8H7NP76_BIOOC
MGNRNRNRSKQKRPRLSNAPPEITSHIWSLLQTSDLRNVCLASKSLRRSAESTLYSAITLKWNHELEPRIITLLETLLRKPQLFDCIHAHSLDGDEFVGDEDPPRALTPSRSAVASFTQAIRKLKTPITGLWVRMLKAGSMDAFAALLIARLSRIRRLTITGDYIRRLDLVGKVLLLKVGGQLPKFEQLRRLVYYHGLDYYAPAPPDRFNEVMGLFHLPTVTHLAAWMGNAQGGAFSWPSGKPDLGHLTSLDIEGSRAATMAEILPLARNLKSLSWRWEYAPWTDDHLMTRNLDLDEVMVALSHIRDSLERLQFRITIHTTMHDGEDRMKVSGSFRGLADFDRISHLDVPLVCLAEFGPEPRPLSRHIPRSVETLSLSTGMFFNDAVEWISGNDGPATRDFLQLLRGLADSRSTSLPRLRSVEIIDEDNDLNILYY